MSAGGGRGTTPLEIPADAVRGGTPQVDGVTCRTRPVLLGTAILTGSGVRDAPGDGRISEDAHRGGGGPGSAHNPLPSPQDDEVDDEQDDPYRGHHDDPLPQHRLNDRATRSAMNPGGGAARRRAQGLPICRRSRRCPRRGRVPAVEPVELGLEERLRRCRYSRS